MVTGIVHSWDPQGYAYEFLLAILLAIVVKINGLENTLQGVIFMCGTMPHAILALNDFPV